MKTTAAEQKTLNEIANRVLHLETLETRMCGLDFGEQAVWNVQQALAEAFAAGRQSAQA